MKRWLPFPLLAACLVGVWLLLVGAVTAGSLILGLALAILGTQALAALDPPPLRLHRPRVAVELAWIVLIEILRSNRDVVRIILHPGRGGRISGFVRIPLDMRSPYGLSILACIITATPGTAWIEYDSARRTVLLHVLDLVAEDDWVRIVKQRYERRLIEIFE